MDWGDEVEFKFASYNKTWIAACFEAYDKVTLEYKTDEKRWHYTFHDCKPKGWTPFPDAKICGDAGGRTTTGKPCRKRVKAGGRCATHGTYDTITLVPKEDCQDLRPFPATVPFSFLGISPQKEGTARLVSPTHIWNEVILHACDSLTLPPEAHLVQADGTEIPAHPLWPTNMMMKMYPDCKSVLVNGKVLKKGYRLEDYGVKSGSHGTIAFS